MSLKIKNMIGLSKARTCHFTEDHASLLFTLSHSAKQGKRTVIVLYTGISRLSGKQNQNNFNENQNKKEWLDKRHIIMELKINLSQTMPLLLYRLMSAV